MLAIKHEFEEYGVAEDVLAELQHVRSLSLRLSIFLDLAGYFMG
jgi:hypothetical protein